MAWLPVPAQDVRDPTIAPAEAGQTPGVAAATASPLGMDGMAVIVRNGNPYLVVGTRLYAPGQTVGKARLERITETEVWFREGTGLRKIPRFAGIQRTVSAADCKPAAPARAATPPRGKTTKKKLATRRRAQTQSAAPSTSPVAAPCTTAQP
ncbi:hypothetical protein [Rhodoferax saidenbachensis]|uniref:Uncharacterized protein n=1 Tax=Rhodoferax saidenbachensis TaxID=1484693 RepID=A0ABU1ZN32_9BURK|nr:hypothetical protein [Rhodoferax saidenbachensis]MDR7306962.1 hypothetical protein [Rhodoferax saidenbachensis]